MDITPRSVIEDLVETSPETSSLAAEYLDSLSREQARFLSATGEWRRRLADDDGQLAAVAALHGRLTQQFFDAQRAILRRRAETDARVRLINERSEAESDQLMDPDSRDIIEDHETGELSYARLDVLDGGDDDGRVDADDIDDDDRSVRQQIADLVATVVRSGDDADSMAEVINDAFIPDEPDGAGAKRALQAVLDRWWESENQESRAAIDDATARAAMRFHLAMVQTGGYNPDALIRHDAAVPQDDVESVEPEPIALEPVEPEPVEPKPVEPKPVAVEPVDPEPVARPLTVHRSVSSMPIIDLDALDAADGTSLEGVLASMLHSLHEPAPEPAVVEASTAGLGGPGRWRPAGAACPPGTVRSVLGDR